MKPIIKPHTDLMLNKPDAWDTKLGECCGLPVCRVDGINYSYWKLNWRERLNVLFGRNVRLSVVGGQPPVMLDTEKI